MTNYYVVTSYTDQVGVEEENIELVLQGNEELISFLNEFETENKQKALLELKENGYTDFKPRSSDSYKYSWLKINKTITYHEFLFG